MILLKQLKLFALWLLVVTCFSASQAQDLSGLWTGQSSGNQVTIEMRSGGFAILVAGVRRGGQYGDGQFFRAAGWAFICLPSQTGTTSKCKCLARTKMSYQSRRLDGRVHETAKGGGKQSLRHGCA